MDVVYCVVYFHSKSHIWICLQAVTTKLRDENRCFKEVHFTLTSDSIKLFGRLTSSPSDWYIECRGSGEVSCILVKHECMQALYVHAHNICMHHLAVIDTYIYHQNSLLFLLSLWAVINSTAGIRHVTTQS